MDPSPRVDFAPASFRMAGQRKSAYEVTRRSIRHAILNGEITPGMRLVQAEVAKQLGVSTTPVREALRDLAAEGLVLFDNYRGAIVHAPHFEEIKEVYEVRLALIPIAIRKAVERIEDREMDKAEKIIVQMDHETDPGSWAEQNRSFHATLEGPANSPHLTSILDRLRNLAEVHVALMIRSRPAQMTDANQDHREILQAFRKRDTAAATDVTCRHLRSTVQVIDDLWDSLP
jgi:DNA-binding GntR family transcriptional regulator